MKRLAFVFSILLFATACNKKIKPTIKKETHYVYFSEDYKNADMTLLGVETSEIDAVWFELYYNENPCAVTDEPDRYALMVKHDGEITKEFGDLASDWNSYITFTPSNSDSYTATLDSGKKAFTITYEFTNRTEELTFNYKEK